LAGVEVDEKWYPLALVPELAEEVNRGAYRSVAETLLYAWLFGGTAAGEGRLLTKNITARSIPTFADAIKSAKHTRNAFEHYVNFGLCPKDDLQIPNHRDERNSAGPRTELSDFSMSRKSDGGGPG